MKPLPGRSAVAALMPAALAMRLFIGMAVDYPCAMNASWLCPLLGFIIYLPLGAVIGAFAGHGSSSPLQQFAIRSGKRPAGAAALLIAALLLYDAAANMRLTAASSNIIALNDVTVHLLVVPLGLAAVAIIHLGADAAGHSARIWLYILPVLLLIAFLVQVKAYRIDWIAPVLGPGFAAIASGAVYCAGCISLLSCSWLVSLPDRNRRGVLVYCACACLAAALLLFALRISFPVMPFGRLTKAARLELILSNGRMSLSPQFILNILWFGGMLYLLACEISIAAAYIRHALVHLPRWVLSAGAATAISCAAIQNGKWLQQSSAIVIWYFPLIGAWMLIPAVCRLYQKEKEKCSPREP